MVKTTRERDAAFLERALITGAASGIGEALAERLAGQVEELILWDRDALGLERTVAACEAKGAT